MSDFIKGTSVLVSLPTLLYTGLAHRRNRLSLLQSLSQSSDVKLSNFLSIPYEFIPLFICLGFGLAYKFIASTRTEEDEDKFVTAKALAVGFSVGLFFSLTGRFGMDLPVKMFNFTPDKAHMVHLVAPPLYMLIFTYVFNLMKIK